MGARHGASAFLASHARIRTASMRNRDARDLGEELKHLLDRLRVLAKEERSAHGPDAEALEIAIVNLDSAIEILTE